MKDRRRLVVPSLLGILAFGTVTGCGDPDESVETVRGALTLTWQDFAFRPMNSPVLFQDGPALARPAVQGAVMTGFGWGTDGQLYWSTQTNDGAWGVNGAVWSTIPGGFTSRPAAVGFNVSSGPLVNGIAVVVRGNDNAYYLRIQDPLGNVTLGWTQIPFGIFSSAPAITFVPASSMTQPKNAIVVAGLGTDGKIYFNRNTLGAGNTFSNSNWVGWVQIQPNFSFTTAPSLAYMYPRVAGFSSLALVAGQSGPGTTVFRFSRFNGSSWGAWTTMNGAFVNGTGPTVAAGDGGEFGPEVTTWGHATDHRLWVSTHVSSGNVNWSPMDTSQTPLIRESPFAFGVGNKVHVGFGMTTPFGPGGALTNFVRSP
jgi:hypothetical protein